MLKRCWLALRSAPCPCLRVLSGQLFDIFADAASPVCVVSTTLLSLVWVSGVSAWDAPAERYTSCFTAQCSSFRPLLSIGKPCHTFPVHNGCNPRKTLVSSSFPYFLPERRYRRDNPFSSNAAVLSHAHSRACVSLLRGCLLRPLLHARSAPDTYRRRLIHEGSTTRACPRKRLPSTRPLLRRARH